jgi:hypothetical protein
MEGRVKSHISNKTYTTDIEKLEEEDINETSELYMIPISGHKIMVAPGKSNMDEDEGIAFCYVYVIKKEKVLCKLGVYEKKTETMPLFFDISTFPEGSFCLFEEYEKNPSKLVDFEMIESLETKANPTIRAPNVYGKNVFDYLTGEFTKIPEKKERIKGAYKSLYETYKSLINVDKEKKNKKMESILRTISEAGKDPEPKDTFLQTLKTNAQDKPVFVMTLLALQRVFLIDFTFVTDYESADEREEYKRMKEDWPISNATKELEVDMNTYTILDPNFVMKDTDVIPEETELDLEVEEESEPVIEVEEPEAEPEVEAQSEPAIEYEPEAEKDPETYSESVVETESEPVVESVKKSRKSTPKSDTGGPDSVKKSRKSTPKSESISVKASKTESMTDVVESLKKPSFTKQQDKNIEKMKSILTKDMRKDISQSKREKTSKSTKSLQESESMPIKELLSNKPVSAKAVSAKAASAENKSNVPTETKIKQTRTIPKIKKATE